jgi:cytochrome c biogenesis protein CcdA
MGLNLMGVIRLPLLYRTYSWETATAGVPVGVASRGGGGRGGPVALEPRSERAWWSGVNYAKSFGVGAAFAVGWTPCIGPVLGAILTLSVSSADAGKGAYLLFVYSLGLGVPFIITGLAVVPMTAFLRRMHGALPLVEVLTGALVVFVGVLLFFDELAIFNGYFSDIPGLDRFNNI